MKRKSACALLFIFLVFRPSLWAAAEDKAYLQRVIGLVHAMTDAGNGRRVFDGQFVLPSETVQVGEKSQAVLQCPDGSLLTLSAGTQMHIVTLQRPSPKEKNFLFHLDAGKIFAQVKKLFSAKSTFEIDAGGVICGVRGTEYSVGYDPKTKTLDLDVFEGTVNAGAGGNGHLFGAGQSGHFVDGHWDGKTGQAPPPPKGVKGGGGGNGSGGNGNGTGGTGSGGSSGTGGTGGGNGGDQSGGGSGTGGDNGNPLGGNGPAPGNPSAGYQPNSALGSLSNLSLGDLNQQFVSGIVPNQDNNINSATQSVHIQVVVPGKEGL